MPLNEISSLKKYGVLNFSPAIPIISEKILEIAGKQIPYFRARPFSRMMKENEEIVLNLSGCKEGRTIFLTASGTGAMDAAVNNLIFPEDRVLIINGGAFGQRFKDICDFYNVNSCNFKVGFGKRINLEELAIGIQEYKPSIVLTQHVETSSGQMHDIKKIGTICKDIGAKFIVDAIGSFGNDKYQMDEWNVDATLFSSHKGLGLFPGTSAVILNKKLSSGPFAKRCFYFDFNKYLEFEMGHDMAMPFTPNVSSMIQLNYRLREIKNKGMDKKIQEVAERAKHFRSLIKGLPLKIVAEDPSNCLTGLYTERTDVKEFYEKMVNKSIYFSPTGGNEGKKFIVTHMGEVNKEDNITFVGELKKWLTL
jgi:aspartate aminotransferase-like enzyme